MPTWNKELIAEGVLAPDLNDEIRDNWAAIEAALTKEHLFSTGETPDSNQGHHRAGSARCYFQDAEPATRINGDAFTSADLGSLWIDTNSTIDNRFSVLTATTPTWTSVSTEIIATLLASARTFKEIITFEKAPVIGKPPSFTEGVCGASSHLVGRNEADDGNVNLIKAARNEADDADVAQLPDVARLASNAAPAEDTQLVNKKFVNDEDAAIAGSLAGGNDSIGETSIGELQMKWGVKSLSPNTLTTITFTSEGLTAFSNACFQVVGTHNEQGTECTLGVTALTATSFKAYAKTNSTQIHWIAIGR